MTTAPAASSHYARGSAVNMIRSLVVIGAIMALFLLALPRPTSVERPAIDVARSASDVADSSGWAVAMPEPIPTGWVATQARFTPSVSGQPTWHLGFETATQEYAALDQASKATAGWVETVVGGSPRAGEVVVGGLTWTRYDNDDTPRHRSLVLTTPTNPLAGDADLTTVVTGTADFSELEELAAALVVVAPTT